MWSLEPGKTGVGNIAGVQKLRRGEGFAVVRLCGNVSQRQQKGGGDGRLYSESMPELASAKMIIDAGEVKVAYAETLWREPQMYGVIPSIALWDPYIRYAGDHRWPPNLKEPLITKMENHVFFLYGVADMFPGMPLGRLAAVTEGGGKRRLFVIGNYIRQRRLRPYHDWAMTVLSRLPTEGTYDQTRPLSRFRG